MSISLAALRDPAIRSEVVRLYTTPPYLPGTEIAKTTRMTEATVYRILREEVPKDRLKLLRSANHHASKMGAKNPMFGVRKQVEAILRRGYRYLWQHETNDYTPEHRLLLMAALGISEWPTGWEVHHIDSNTLNNNLNNLAIVTKTGHQLLHSQKLQKLYAWEKREFGTSQLMEMLATARKD
jgi:hypothetical protein